MKKTALIRLIFACVTIGLVEQSYAQDQPTKHIIAPSGSVETIQSVHVADLNEDGNKDILSASEADDKLAWYENTGGSFSEQTVISTAADRPMSVYAADISGNSYLDVISASRGDDKIAWYKNIDGEGSFSEQKIITTSAPSATAVFSSDLDGDGDQDVIYVAEGTFNEESMMAWQENEDGEGTFSEQNIITRDVPLATDVLVADLDSDGDMDAISASAGSPDKIAWYENTDGQGSFSDEKIITNNTGNVQEISKTDLDKDGNIDILSASEMDDTIAWYENIDGQDSFGYDEITTVANGANSVAVGDLDADTDADVLSIGAAAGENVLGWYEQINTPDSTAFSSQKVVDVARGEVVEVADLTGNSFPDIISGIFFSNKGDQLVWYENTSDVLPVELVSFEVTSTEGNIRLTWQTATETSNSGFEVQRRAEGSSWTTVGFVEGAGTTSEPQSYRFTDADLPYDADQLSYRLRQVDIDGTATLSDPVVVERSISEVELLGTFPNPASQQATIRYALPTRQDVEVRLYDALGRQVRTIVNAQKEGRHEETIDVGRLSSGTYFLQLQTDGQTKTQQLTVTR